MSTTEHARLRTEQHPDLAAFEVKSRASEIETVARMTFEFRLDSMGETVAVFDAKRRASRWSNQQARKYRKVAYLFGQIADYRTNEKQASWAWLARKYAKLHKGEAISDRALRRLAKEMAAIGLIEIRANQQVEHDDCICRHCEHPGASEQNTYAVHVGRRVNNKGQLAVHDFNAPLPDADEKPAGSAECQQCGAAFDPKRPDARYCSARCRKAASRASVTDTGHGDVTDNDHPVDHRVDHPVGHPYLLEIPSEIPSSSSGRDDDEAACGGPEVLEIINILNQWLEMLNAWFSLDPILAKSKITALATAYGGQTVLDAASWWTSHDCPLEAPDVLLSRTARNPAGVMVFLLESKILPAYAEYLAAKEARVAEATLCIDNLLAQVTDPDTSRDDVNALLDDAWTVAEAFGLDINDAQTDALNDRYRRLGRLDLIKQRQA